MTSFSKNGKDFQCPIELALHDIGGKWKVLILWRIYENQPIRYGELKRILPQKVTHNSLSRALKELKDSKLINKKDYKSIPPKVEYSISELGLEMIPALELIRQWGLRFKTD